MISGVDQGRRGRHNEGESGSGAGKGKGTDAIEEKRASPEQGKEGR